CYPFEYDCIRTDPHVVAYMYRGTNGPGSNRRIYPWSQIMVEVTYISMWSNHYVIPYDDLKMTINYCVMINEEMFADHQTTHSYCTTPYNNSRTRREPSSTCASESLRVTRKKGPS